MRRLLFFVVLIAGCERTPPLPTYPGVCPTLVSNPNAAMARNRNFMSRSDAREFLLVVPPNYSPTKRYPVIFGFWRTSLGDLRQLDIESAVAQFEFIAVLPEPLVTDGKSAYQFDWPFVEAEPFSDKEQGFFEDVLACVSRQFTVDPSRVHVFGGQAGGLWAGYVSTTPTVNRIASVLTVSGGLGQGNPWRTDFVPQSNKFPALVVWNGEFDVGGELNFDLASRRYRHALRTDGHFVAWCDFSAGSNPGPADGGTRYPMFWQFFRDHPYGLPPNSSPYQDGGLPPSFPNGCTIVP